MEQNIIFIGIILILVGFFLVFLGSFLGAKDSKVEVGFGGFIGPIPFGFATNKSMLYLVILISIIFFIIFLLSIKYF